MTESTGHWRFNSNVTWHYFCSLCSSGALHREAQSDFMKYHHLRTQLYFAICVMESFMNTEMRKFLSLLCEDEDAIYKKLRSTRFYDKISEWPGEIIGSEFNFDDDFWEFYDSYKDVRDEITHPKKRDHSIYISLEAANPSTIQASISRAIVKFHEISERPWPYWLTGWNYVGMNNDPSWPAELNNLNGFYHSLLNLGLRGLGNQMDFEKRCMMSREHLKLMVAFLDSFGVEIEPFSIHFPQRPRLTRRWWDHQYLLAEHRRNTDAPVHRPHPPHR